MKRLLVLAALTALVVPATATAKGPDRATITGPGLDKAITVAGPEEEGSPMMQFAEAAGFFPAVFTQTPDPMLPERPKGSLGPKYSIEYNVPGPEGDAFTIHQDLYPYATPSAVTYMKPGQDIFELPGGTRGGWFTDSTLKDQLVALGLPKSATAAEAASSAGFFSTGRLGVLLVVLLLVGSAAVVMRRRSSGDATA
jgi:hypothetical protein